ncbi:acyl carrier protein 1, chloroplastic [Daucus carota subsp. sativus]|uniref:acyl carrier protein 1, chloroplastic n=1 Tax=Daucus carota subsp. sativus TaxID=79200 RepID=UPI0007B2C5FF|nr:PREDICTED: acyl carrier protein 1, chloroplastic-like [Daucus carota subsp. sativus]
MASLLTTSATLLVSAAPFAPKCTSSTSTLVTSSSSSMGGLRLVPKIQISYAAAANRSLPSSHRFKTATISCSAAKPETLQIVQSTIAKQLSIDETAVAPGIKFADLGADSLDTVEIMMALEEKFGVSIGEGGAENIATVQDAADLIEKVKAASA